MSSNKSYIAIVPQTNWAGSLLFRFTPTVGLQCFADGSWYQVSQGPASGSSEIYSFKSPISISGDGSVYLESFTVGATNNANKVVVTDDTGKIPQEALPDSSVVTWVDLT